MDKQFLEKNANLNSVTFIEQIIEIIENNDKSAIGELLSDFHDYDVAKTLPFLTANQRKKLYGALNDEQLSDIFSYLENPAEFVNIAVYVNNRMSHGPAFKAKSLLITQLHCFK